MYIFYVYKSITYANKIVGHIIFINSYLGHVTKNVEKHWVKSHSLPLS